MKMKDWVLLPWEMQNQWSSTQKVSVSFHQGTHVGVFQINGLKFVLLSVFEGGVYCIFNKTSSLQAPAPPLQKNLRLYY